MLLNIVFKVHNERERVEREKEKATERANVLKKEKIFLLERERFERDTKVGAG